VTTLDEKAREVAKRVGWEHSKGPGWRLAHVDDIEKAIKRAIERDRAARPVTVTDEDVERALKAAQSAFNSGHPADKRGQMRAALEAAVHTPAPSPDTLGRVAALESLVRCLLDNDPDDIAADGGITVLDVWRKDAKRILASSPDFLARVVEGCARVADDHFEQWSQKHQKAVQADDARLFQAMSLGIAACEKIAATLRTRASEIIAAALAAKGEDNG